MRYSTIGKVIYAGARYYSDRLGIWLSVDPPADKYPGLSPYAYCANNPVMFVEPDGRADDEWDINSKGEIVNHIKTDKQRVYLKNGIFCL